MFSCGPDQTQVRRQLEASCRALAAVVGQREPRDSSTWKSLIPGPDISQRSKTKPIHLHKKAHIMNYKRKTNIERFKMYLSRQDRKVHDSSRKQSAQLCYEKIQHVRKVQKVQRGRFHVVGQASKLRSSKNCTTEKENQVQQASRLAYGSSRASCLLECK